MSEGETPFAAFAKKSISGFVTSSRRTRKDRLYATLEDFVRADPSLKRLVVIGCIGSGKSTLMNVLAGWRFVQSKETDYEFKWLPKGEGEDAIQPIFEAAISSGQCPTLIPSTTCFRSC